MNGSGDNWRFLVNAFLVGALMAAAPMFQGNTVVVSSAGAPQGAGPAAAPSANAGNGSAAASKSESANAPAAGGSQTNSSVAASSTQFPPPPVIRPREGEGGRSREGGYDD